MRLRPLFLLALGAVLTHAAAACVGGADESELNPQPLPPSESSGGAAGSGADNPDRDDAPNTSPDAGPDGASPDAEGDGSAEAGDR